VFRPDIEEEDLPVMVWVFGGSYCTGGAGLKSSDSEELEYDMTKFARDTKTIVVTFNYRLNMEGFLNLSYIDPSFEMNNGLYDQIAALGFVRENIGAFGGDDRNITVFGQSAGAACILALMTHPDAAPLFDKAIVQSACVDSFWNIEESMKMTESFLKYIGIGKADIAKIREVSAADVFEAARKLKKKVMGMGDVRCAFSPVIDGVTIKDYPSKLAASCDKPLLMGTNQQEANLFVNEIPDILMPLAALKFHLAPEHGKGARNRYSDQVTKAIYRGPALAITSAYKGEAWTYEYTYQTPSIRQSGAGCFHASELPVLFGYDLGISPVDDPETKKTGDLMRSIWGEFARTGKCAWTGNRVI
jgi:para-nitrobenzyl esterase